MFYRGLCLGVVIGAIAMTIFCIIAFQEALRQCRADAAWWQRKAEQYAAETRELEKRLQ